MSDVGTACNARVRARCLAIAQLPPLEIEGVLVLEELATMDEAHEIVEAMAVELVSCKQGGRGLARERLWKLNMGEDLGKLTGANLAAMQTVGRAYLGLHESELDQLREALEKAERDLAKKGAKGLKVA